MKNQFQLLLLAVSMWAISNNTNQVSAAQVFDPGMNLKMTISDQNAVISWFGANGVQYQLESSSTLTTWADVGPALTGSGAILLVTNPIAGQSSGFYRVKRLFPAADGSAVYDPVTGVLTVVGDDGDNVITVSRADQIILVNGGAVPITGGVATVSNTVLIQVLGRAGNDQLTIVLSGGAMPPAHLFGDLGNDTLTGGNAADVLMGGPGSDTFNGQAGMDLIFGEEGDDIFIWDPGESNDVIEGGTGQDLLVVNGSAASENIDLSAIGPRLRFFRNVATVTIDADGVERVDFNAASGTDNIVVNSLVGTAVTQVNVNLAANGGGGDLVVDSVTLNGTAAAETINVAADAGAVVATGLGVEVRVINGEPSLDRLAINGVGGDLVNVNGSATTNVMQVLPSLVAGYAEVVASDFTALVDVAGALTLSVNGLGDADTIFGFGNLAVLGIPLRFDGGEGNDTISGGNAGELLIGGPGKDLIDGNQGSDTILMGDDDDTFVWDPGDGNDVVEGQGGADAILFNGAVIGENIELSAIGPRLRLTRNIATVVLDAEGVERVDCRALGGADNLTVNSLAGTAVTLVNFNLASSTSTGDSQADVVTINGSAAQETFNIACNAGAVVVSGPATEIRITQAEINLDRLILNCIGNDFVNVDGSALLDTMVVEPNGTYARVNVTGYTVPMDIGGALTLTLNSLDGTDTIAGIGDLAALGIPIQMNGGDGDDTIYGSNGADVIFGGNGHDVVDGQTGSDTIFLGDGDDTLYWDPSDGNDVVEGELGADAIVLYSSGASENFDLSAVGPRLHLFCDTPNFTLDVDGVERIDYTALGGADHVVVNSLAGTAVTQVNIDLAGTLGGTGDAQPDVVTVNGTAAPDTINVSANGNTVAVFGLSALVWIMNAEPASDVLIVNGLGGNDTLIAGPGASTAIVLTLNQD